ncbi:RNA dependent RNA polymerase [Diatom colony associated dsRNA virus 1]|nr:RNA dependent RNA polymerase [Diatom colony associated dsRNA virus 1]
MVYKTQNFRYSFISKLNLDSVAVRKLSLLLNSVVSGSNVAQRSPIGKSMSAADIVSAWSAIFEKDSSALTEGLMRQEMKNKQTIGPRSMAIPWSLRSSSVHDYYSSDNNRKLKNNSYHKPYRTNRLRPIELKKALSFIKNNTNSGLPSLTRKGMVKDALEKSLNHYLSRKDPCVLFTRTQEDFKTRNVWGYPAADVVNEMRYYRPILDYQKGLPWRTALVSPEATDLAITHIMKEARENGFFLVSIDFSSYDATVSSEKQTRAFTYVKDLFQSAYSEEIDYIAERFNTIGLVTPDGILTGKHGVPSGSTFTNEIDSIVQYLIAKDFGISDDHMNIQGDDGVYCVKDPSALLKHFEENGLKVNYEKSLISDCECLFLQNYYSFDYIRNGQIKGIYPTYRALCRILYPERYTNYSVEGIAGASYNSIRTISILENCSQHPLFREFVTFIYSLDKYCLSFESVELSKYIKQNVDSTGTEGLFNYRRGLDLKGIYKFKTVQLINELNSG